MPEYGISVEEYKGMSSSCLDRILSAISGVNIALIGDLCLDVYWKADMTRSELSRETPHYPLPVVEEWMSPGAGGNTAANIAALGPEKLFLTGVVGDDWRGRILLDKLKEHKNIDPEGILISGRRITNAYCKPLRKGTSDLIYEDPRIDFTNFTPLSEEDESILARNLEAAAEKADILCVSDQFEFGCITPGIREKINELGRKGLTVVVDSRYRIGLYTNVILKPNEMEGWRAVHGDSGFPGKTIQEHAEIAYCLAQKNNARVCMTLGSKGCVCIEEKKAIHVPSYEVKPPIDIVGAGDTFLSAFSCALAAGANAREAASFANMAADVTIRKTGTTGTASREEIHKRHNEIFGGAKAE